jgi:hypothetical protein
MRFCFSEVVGVGAIEAELECEHTCYHCNLVISKRWNITYLCLLLGTVLLKIALVVILVLWEWVIVLLHFSICTIGSLWQVIGVLTRIMGVVLVREEWVGSNIVER